MLTSNLHIEEIEKKKLKQNLRNRNGKVNINQPHQIQIHRVPLKVHQIRVTRLCDILISENMEVFPHSAIRQAAMNKEQEEMAKVYGISKKRMPLRQNKKDGRNSLMMIMSEV